MSEKDCCAGCRFVSVFQPNKNDAPDYLCRRYPPLVMSQAIPQPGVVGGRMHFEWLKAGTFPLTRADMWCGEFQAALSIAKPS